MNIENVNIVERFVDETSTHGVVFTMLHGII